MTEKKLAQTLLLLALLDDREEMKANTGQCTRALLIPILGQLRKKEAEKDFVLQTR